MIRPSLGCCLFAFAVLGTASTQADDTSSARQDAVKIDRVAVPSAEPALLERLASHLRFPWSVAFVPNGDLLITEKRHGVRLHSRGQLSPDAIPGGPENALAKGDSGLLDIALDPDFQNTRRVFIAFAEGTTEKNRTAVWTARLVDRRFVDGRVIFRATPDKAGPDHPGGRLLFLADGTFLLTVGDGYDYRASAQDLGSHLGKTLRLTRDGKAPPDNPFVNQRGALPEIYSLGHRNAQGLTLDPKTGDTWLHEHGPRGGDEINLLLPGRNYGWPSVTFGIDYDGKLVSERLAAPGFELPKFFWAPSIAPSGLAIYRGAAFPDWDGKTLVGGLACRCVIVLRRGKETGLPVEEGRYLSGLGYRFRDVRVGPDSLVYLLTDEEDGQLLRWRPK